MADRIPDKRICINTNIQHVTKKHKRQNREARFSFSALGNLLDPVIIVEVFGITIFQLET